MKTNNKKFLILYFIIAIFLIVSVLGILVNYKGVGYASRHHVNREARQMIR